jgi:hypothetical protein
MTDQQVKLLDDDKPDEFVPDPQVWREFGITSMSGYRFDRRPELGFPPPIRIGRENTGAASKLKLTSSA